MSGGTGWPAPCDNSFTDATLIRGVDRTPQNAPDVANGMVLTLLKFSVGGSSRKAAHYVVHVEIGGAAGLVAPLLGKQPPDTHVWILGGEAPAFVKSEGPLFLGGPIWRIELTSPVWPSKPAGDSKENATDSKN